MRPKSSFVGSGMMSTCICLLGLARLAMLWMWHGEVGCKHMQHIPHTFLCQTLPFQVLQCFRSICWVFKILHDLETLACLGHLGRVYKYALGLAPLDSQIHHIHSHLCALCCNPRLLFQDRDSASIVHCFLLLFFVLYLGNWSHSS